MTGEDWTAANQALLVAEFARLRAQIAGDDASTAKDHIRTARKALTPPAAIDLLVEHFGLSSFERDVLLLCAGIEMDGTLAAACNVHGVSSAHGQATFGLALAKLANPHWSALTPLRPLRAFRLVMPRDEYALSSSRLCIDERVLHFLVGVNYLDPRLKCYMREQEVPDSDAEGHERIIEYAISLLHANRSPPLIQLLCDDAAGAAAVAHQVCVNLARRLHVIRSADLPRNALEAGELASLWCRESVLLGSALLIVAEDDDKQSVNRLVEGINGLVFIAAQEPLVLSRADHTCRIQRLSSEDQKKVWIRALGTRAAALNGSIDAIAGQFHLNASDIVHIAREMDTRVPDPQRIESAIWQACRDRVRIRLDDLAQRISSASTWEDLVLPQAQLSQLRQIASHVRQRLRVYERWGFASRSSRGLGISALFSGESGTGKTMAAEVLANDLRLDLYRIDLSSMVSKYVGETEKNLRRVFDAAEDSGAILLFDEADALFGKRSEVKDSHDRYANIEVSYLLQRMEEYRGLAILTTNLKNALDGAFMRRLRFVVQFPFPDLELREQIWRRVFPAEAPLMELDHRRLAQLNISGGNIRNIAMNAAFLAADGDTSISMHHLLLAARSEATKRDRPFSDAEIRGWS